MTKEEEKKKILEAINKSKTTKSNHKSYNEYSDSDLEDRESRIITFQDKYRITKELGSGSFGYVYETILVETGEHAAIKVEDKQKSNKVENEYKIYTKLRRFYPLDGIPKVYEFIEAPKFNMMVMEILGESLEDMLNKYDRKLELGTVLNLGVQIIKLLEVVHTRKYIHRDIKPNNFLLGRSKKNNQVYIMDFGLSKKYIKNDKHISLRTNRSLVGTPRYASINMHMGFEPSRRDDLESVGYMLVYFLIGRLPWQGIKKKGESHIKEIGNVKISTPLSILCKEIPDCFKDYISYCRDLKFDEKPDYEMLRSLFKFEAKKRNLELKFQWENKIIKSINK